MEETKECPLCGELMRLHDREHIVVIPGTSETRKTRSWEWICPECDYFEDKEEHGEGQPRDGS